MDDKLLTVAQAAERLATSRWTLYRLIESGALPHVRIGPNAIRFRPASLDSWLDSRTREVEAAK